MIPLFQIPFKAGLSQPPIHLLCQSVTVDREMLLWVDGVNAQDPLVIPLSAVASSRLVTDFESFVEANRDLAERVLTAGAGEISPTITVRAIAAMLADPQLDAESALELVNGQALDLIDADQQSQAFFWGSNGPVSTGAARGASLPS